MLVWQLKWNNIHSELGYLSYNVKLGVTVLWTWMEQVLGTPMKDYKVRLGSGQARGELPLLDHLKREDSSIVTGTIFLC